MRITVVEDDYLQAEWIVGILRSEFRQAQLQVIGTEAAFRSTLSEFEREPPDLIVMDVMLRWADPSPEIQPAPEDVRSGGFYRAGLRCVRLLQAGDVTRGVPVILYTVLERNDLHGEMEELPAHVIQLTKRAQPEPLLAAARDLMKAR